MRSATPEVALQGDKRPETRANRLAAIRGLRLRPLATSHQTGRMRRLLEQIEVCSALDGSGSNIRQEALASRLLITERSLRRWLTLAVEEGLIEFWDTWTIRGRKRTIKICWDRVLDGPTKQQLFFEFERVPSGQNQPEEEPDTEADVRSNPVEMSGPNKEDLFSRDIQEKAPLPPEAAPLASTSSQEPGREEEWQEVRETVESRGVLLGGSAVAACRRRGCEPWQLLAVIRFYDRFRDRWRSPGALYRRLEVLRPGYVPEAGSDLSAAFAMWPGGNRDIPRQAPRAESRSEAPACDLTAERERARADAARELAELRQALGFFWDDRSRDERLEIVAEHGGKFFADLVSRRKGRLESRDWTSSDAVWLRKWAAARLEEATC